jgi:hypothetical protein
MAWCSVKAEGQVFYFYFTKELSPLLLWMTVIFDATSEGEAICCAFSLSYQNIVVFRH